MVEMNLTAENIQVETGVQVGEAMKSTLHLVQIFINITFCASIKMFTCLNHPSHSTFIVTEAKLELMTDL